MEADEEGGGAGEGQDVGVVSLCNLGGTSHITKIIPPPFPSKPTVFTKWKIKEIGLGSDSRHPHQQNNSPVCGGRPDKQDGSEIHKLFLPLPFLFFFILLSCEKC